MDEARSQPLDPGLSGPQALDKLGDTEGGKSGCAG